MLSSNQIKLARTMIDTLRADGGQGTMDPAVGGAKARYVVLESVVPMDTPVGLTEIFELNEVSMGRVKLTGYLFDRAFAQWVAGLLNTDGSPR